MTTCFICGNVGDEKTVDPSASRCIKRRGCAARFKIGGWGAQASLRLTREKDRRARRDEARRARRSA